MDSGLDCNVLAPRCPHSLPVAKKSPVLDLTSLDQWFHAYRQPAALCQVGRGVNVQVETVFRKLVRNGLLSVGEELCEHLPCLWVLGAPRKDRGHPHSTRWKVRRLSEAQPCTGMFEFVNEAGMSV